MSRVIVVILACIAVNCFVFCNAVAQTTTPKIEANVHCPNWSAKFDAVDDAEIMVILRSHRDAGWDAVIEQGEKAGASLAQQIIDGEQQLTISRDAEQRARAGMTLPKRGSEADRKAECSTGEGKEKNLTCQAQVRHNEVLALEGILDLLRCRLPSHPGAPAKPEGAPIASYSVKVVPDHSASASKTDDGCQCDQQKAYAHALTLGMKQNGQSVEVKEGSYIILRFEPGNHATAFSVEPDQKVLQIKGGSSFPKNVIGILKAQNAGNSKITVYAKMVSSASKEQVRAQGETSKNAQFDDNWSGYILSSTPSEMVRGEWTVPEVQWTMPGKVAVWTGIDGASDMQLIQAGITAGFNSGFLGIGTGTYYYAWWEVLPAPESPISNPVTPGDRMAVTITPFPPGTTAAPNVPSLWTILIKNLTSGWTFSILVSYVGELSSGEWIVEDPETCGPFSCGDDSLPQFSNVTFDVGNLVATGTGAPAPPTFTTAFAFSILQDQGILASPSVPDCDGDGFTVEEAGTAPPPPGPWPDPFSLSSASLPSGTVGAPYKTQLKFKDLLPPFSQSVTITSGTLPPGLTLDAPTGTLSGTPTQAGNFNFSVTGADLSTKDDTGAMATCTVPESLKIGLDFPRIRCLYSRTLHKLVCY